MHVYALPLALFSDDTSGNKSKKWHNFRSWYLKLAGLSGQTSSKVCSIHFVCCSDNLCTLELGKPIAEELLLLETQH